MAGIHREAAAKGQAPTQKLAATIDILRQILGPIGDDLVSLRDRALLLIGFAGALRRAELAAIRVEHIEIRDRGLRLTLPHSKGERTDLAVTVAIPYGTTALCPYGLSGAGRTPQASRKGPDAPRPGPVVGEDAIDAGSIARIVKLRAKAAGFDPAILGSHSLKRGAMTTGMDRGVHPTRLKQLGRHKTYAVLDTYLESGDPFESHPLADVM